MINTEVEQAVSKSKSGLTEKKREDILKDLGFKPDRECDGSHTMWVHPELKQLARTHKIEAPANVANGTPWQMSVPENPANGTWDGLVKQAKWCHEKVQEIETGSAHEQQRLKLARDFRKASGEYNAWKKSMQHWLQSGLDPSDPNAPRPPMPWKDLQKLNPKNQPKA